MIREFKEEESKLKIVNKDEKLSGVLL